MAEVTTTIVVNFDNVTGSQSVLTAEIDSRSDGFNNGKTTFQGGDQPVYLVFKTQDVTITDQEPSEGIIAPFATGQLDVEQIIQFPNEREQSLSRVAVPGTLAWTWLGNGLGTLTLIGQTAVRADIEGVGVAQVTYKAAFEAFQLTNVPFPIVPGVTTFPVLIVITGETP